VQAGVFRILQIYPCKASADLLGVSVDAIAENPADAAAVAVGGLDLDARRLLIAKV
jgi:hypothetical protein